MPSAGSSRRNLEKARRALSRQEPRSFQETLIIKRLVWQWVVQPQPKPPQRQLARQLNVSQPYVQKIARRFPAEGMQTLLDNRPVTVDDLVGARKRCFAGSTRQFTSWAAETRAQSTQSFEPPNVKLIPDPAEAVQACGPSMTYAEWEQLEEDGRRYGSKPVQRIRFPLL